MENPNYKKLIKVLEEIFQLNQADLDFGIYRIMNYKRDEILQFLNEDLIPQVKAILSENLSGDKSSVQKDLDDAIKAAQGLGMNPDDSPKVQQLRQQLTGSTDIEAEENAVFAQLANFFKRYYEGGDFISLRRYKEGVYAIPYEGEEVKLHWANHDQYYIKTSEYLKNYAFKLSNGKLVRFLLSEASTEQNNNKSSTGQERRFALYEEEPMKVAENELQIFFTYEPVEKSVKQTKLLNTAFDTLKSQIPSDFQEVLVSNEKSKTVKQSNRTLLEKHLRDYTARNTFDYFIHKNLGKFLRQELDFFIKNEVLFLDDINTRDTNDFIRQLSQVRALKSIGLKIIAFLEQLENFQKKLWLKKKFVVETQYCFTLDRVPEELYSEIIENQEQIEEWKKLFHIQDIKVDEDKSKELFEDYEVVNYSEPLSLAFLKANQFLVLDTKFFPNDFKNKIIASFESLDEELNGILINSENFQALNLLKYRFAEKVNCIYIDPPYNTDATPIVYKNGFKESSWLSLIHNRVELSDKFLEKKSGVLSVAIDDTELDNLGQLLSQIYPTSNLQRAIVNHYPGSGTGRSNLSRTHEYNLFVIPEGEDILKGKEKEGGTRERNFRRAGTGENNYRTGRKNSFFAVLVDEKSLKVIDVESPPENDYPTSDTKEGYKRIYPIGEDGSERVWSLSYEGAKSAILSNMLRCTPKFVINRIYHDEKSRGLLKSVWLDSKFSATTQGTNLLTSFFGMSGLFSYPKSIFTTQTAIDSITHGEEKPVILDYFAGSGTTAHAVINLNRNDDGERKYIIVEMGNYFDTVTKPRVQKVIYSLDWENGKPLSRKGSSHCFKYVRLESYEDALNNLSLNRKDDQSLALKDNPDFREGYMLNYMLDSEVQDSLLNIVAFEDPFNYYLNITRQNEIVLTKVDMVETFNYLIGLVVEQMDIIRGFQIVEGKNIQDERILVIWRNTKEKDNNALNNFFQKMGYSTRDQEFSRIYVNGDNNLENLRTEEDRWKVVLIEEEFKRRMFEVEDI
ncbi:MAG: hypothetical protein MK078_17995 [Crocinitomicaceae bacterium]|nr:hypothetical protein [Crocinitomicaceae bacterium]